MQIQRLVSILGIIVVMLTIDARTIRRLARTTIDPHMPTAVGPAHDSLASIAGSAHQ